MRQKDRNRIQVPANLPDWMDGPTIQRRAEIDGCSYGAAKNRLLYDYHYKRFSKLLRKKRKP